MNNHVSAIREATAVILLKSRLRSGLSREEVATRIGHLSALELEQIESGESALEGSILYELINNVYSATRQDLFYFCTIQAAGPIEIFPETHL